ncbi:MAG TPA: hypothetical protein VM115_11825 [Vicinamibacterales bacterium]|nr:hypothetical protein [Vicinamibacterales bacterium]
MTGDIEDESTMHGAFDGCDVVIHDAAARVGRIVFISSTDVYGFARVHHIDSIRHAAT